MKEGEFWAKDLVHAKSGRHRWHSVPRKSQQWASSSAGRKVEGAASSEARQVCQGQVIEVSVCSAKE